MDERIISNERLKKCFDYLSERILGTIESLRSTVEEDNCGDEPLGLPAKHREDGHEYEFSEHTQVFINLSQFARMLSEEIKPCFFAEFIAKSLKQ